MKVRQIITDDRSPTLYVSELDEYYHSKYGAIQESNHVFINSGLRQIDKKQINILEIGFGTGLNAVLTYEFIKKTNQKVYYETIEKYPLNHEIYDELLFEDTDHDFFKKIHKIDWNKLHFIEQNFSIKKIETDLKKYETDQLFDLIYFDAFGPEKQPNLWTEDIFRKIYKCMNNNAIFVTYSAKGIVKQALRNSGFIVKRISGPPGKRHMIRAFKETEKYKF